MNKTGNPVRVLNDKIKGHEQLIAYYKEREKDSDTGDFTAAIKHHKNLIKYLEKRKLIVQRQV